MSNRKKVLFTIGALVLSLLCIEIVVRISMLFLDSRPIDPRERAMLGRANLKIVTATDWGRDFFLKDVEGLGGTELRLLTGWRPPEYHSAYLNIDANGERKTWNPTVTSSSQVVKVFVFGGSTVWGAGSRDEYTIPSMLSKKLNTEAKDDRTYIVRNFGEPGFSNLVETAKLLLLLQDGERPDMVIFYDGGNDVLAAYQMGVAGPKGTELAIQSLYDATVGQTTAGRIVSWMKDSVKDICVTCRVLFSAVRNVDSKFLNPTEIAGQALDDAELENFSADIAGQYKGKTVSFLNGLANAFRFKLYVFWQPIIFTEDRLIGEEQTLGNFDTQTNDTKAKALYRAVSSKLPTDALAHFYNIANVLSARTRECYLDYIHISEECDGMVASRMIEIMQASSSLARKK